MAIGLRGQSFPVRLKILAQREFRMESPQYLLVGHDRDVMLSPRHHLTNGKYGTRRAERGSNETAEIPGSGNASCRGRKKAAHETPREAYFP
jgi:hypothetical protein